jgi:hypothetical protein
MQLTESYGALIGMFMAFNVAWFHYTVLMAVGSATPASPTNVFEV